jgi:indolepyruvate ferredoxin oxidoreductase beta subunit
VHSDGSPQEENLLTAADTRQVMNFPAARRCRCRSGGCFEKEYANVKQDLVLAGVGGQGILSIAAIIAKAALDRGLNLKQSEVHGMAQRGGDVSAHLRLSSEPIFSDLIPRGGADIVLAVEPLEALRHLTFLSADGVLLANSTPLVNIPNYPEPEAVCAEIRQQKRHVLIDADAMGREAGSPRSMNMVMLGALSAFLDLPEEALRQGVADLFQAKGEKVLDVNLKAFAAGRAAAQA